MPFSSTSRCYPLSPIHRRRYYHESAHFAETAAAAAARGRSIIVIAFVRTSGLKQSYYESAAAAIEHHRMPRNTTTTTLRNQTKRIDASSRTLNHAQISVHACACACPCSYFQLSIYLKHEPNRRSPWQRQRRKDDALRQTCLEALRKRNHVTRGYSPPHNCDNHNRGGYVTNYQTTPDLAPLHLQSTDRANRTGRHFPVTGNERCSV